MKKTKAVTYPYLNKLKIPVYLEPIPHVNRNDVRAVLTKEQSKLFNDYFGAQTCPIITKELSFYPWDVEPILNRIFTGKITGNQKPELWD